MGYQMMGSSWILVLFLRFGYYVPKKLALPPRFLGRYLTTSLILGLITFIVISIEYQKTEALPPTLVHEVPSDQDYDNLLTTPPPTTEVTLAPIRNLMIFFIFFFYTIFKTYLQIKICVLVKRLSGQENREEYIMADFGEMNAWNII